MLKDAKYKESENKGIAGASEIAMNSRISAGSGLDISAECERPGRKSIKAFSSKLAVLLCLCLIFTLSFTSCGDNGSSETGGKEYAEAENTGASLNAPFDHSTFRPNDIDYEVQDENGERPGCLSISGLADKEIENKINELIVETYDSVLAAGVPSYRGIKAKIGNEPRVYDKYGIWGNNGDHYMSVYIAGNYNNIISVVFSRGTDYYSKQDDEYSVNVEFTMPLNIDLNTGEEITLADAFGDNVDGVKYLTDFMNEKIVENNMMEETDDFFNYDYFSLKLLGNFSGIKEEQKFYFNSAPGINLVFDHETPEFLTGYSGTQSFTLCVPFSDNMAFLDRYYDEGKCLFESGITKKALMWSAAPDYEYTVDSRKLSEELFSTVEITTQIPKDTPESMKKMFLSKFDTDIDAYCDEINSYLEKAAELYADIGYYCSASRRMYVEKCGKYYSVTYNEYDEVSGNITEEDWQNDPDFDWTSKQVYLKSDSVYETYKENSNAPMTVEELFADDVDYKQVLRDAYTVNIQGVLDSYMDSSEKYEFASGDHKENDLKFLNKLVDEQCKGGVLLGSNSLSFKYHQPEEVELWLEEAYGEDLADLPFGEIYMPFDTTLEYDIIGYDNLAIF